MNGITGIGSGFRYGTSGASGAAPAGGEGFASALREAVDRVRDLEAESGAEIKRFLTGESEDLHKMLLSIQKSELAFEMLLQVRNKVVQAYQEIMRMQV